MAIDLVRTDRSSARGKHHTLLLRCLARNSQLCLPPLIRLHESSSETIDIYSIDLAHSLAALSDLTADDSTHPAAATIRSILIPPEVIDYVANGRNPDIYTREFVENVQRGNQVLNGKMQAFGQFAEIYARETKSSIPELADGMDRLMKHSEAFEKEDGTGDWKMKKPQANER